jgi:Glycosyl hydrolase family 79 C-terminal beta domain
VVRAVGKRLLAFEIGNEPDLYVHEGHRPRYSYEQYLAEYRRYKSAVRAALPRVGLAGPDAAGATGWVERFAADEGRDLRLLTHHYYREGQNAASTADKLLRPDPKLAAMLDRMRVASQSSGVPYRICETNSFSGGGRPGVSDTFAAALWALDYLCVLAWHGADGVNMETGINQLDFISSYSPIGDDRHGHYHAAPEYHGMLAFAEGCRGERIAVSYDAGAVNLTAYGTVNTDDTSTLVIVNKDEGTDADIRIRAGSRTTNARVLRLAAPSLDSKSGVTLGGAAVGQDGEWRGRSESARMIRGVCGVHVPAASAAIVKLQS